MRLTLRTLLAYMDDILDPADHEDLGNKIEASEFAAELIHRSRDTVRRLRLGAPEVFPGEDDDVLNPDPASDANSVAEYLDNTLPPEHVADFERVCLDTGTVADMHLAEVTSCHHVLTMVLGEPAEIDPQVRRRMYELPQTVEGGEKLRIEPAHPPVAASVSETVLVMPQAVVPVPVAAVAPAPAAGVLPDYLRVAANSRRRGRRWAIAAVLAALGGLTAYVLSGSFVEPETPSFIADAEPEKIEDLTDIQIGMEPSDTNPEDSVAGTNEMNTAHDATNLAPRFVPEDGGVAAPEDQAPAVAEPSLEPPAAATEGAETNSTPTVPKLSTDSSADDPETTTPAETSATAADAPPAMIVPLPPQDSEPEETTISDGRPPVLDPNELIESATTQTMPDDSLIIDDEVEVPTAPKGPAQLGTYRGVDDVLLRYLPEAGQWVRLPSQAVIAVGETLLTLPKYRSHVVLGNINAYLAGGTQITLPEQSVTEDGDEPLVIDMSYGRLILNADAGARDIKLNIDGATHEIRLQKAASLAVDVHRLFVPGTDYEKAPAVVEINWYLANGTAVRIGTNGTQDSVQAPSVWKSVNGADTVAESITTLPSWIEKEPVTSLERSASNVLNQQLVPGQPVELSIAELTDQETSNRENRRLASEASLYVGEFEPFIKSLNDSDQRTVWRSHIAAMRQAIARDPQLAVKLHEDYINVRGPEAGEDLFAMLRGFTPEQIGLTRDQLKQGVLLELIRWLEDEKLDYRVLAIYNLDELKGTKELKGYRPDAIPRSRQIAVEKIRRDIQGDEFLPLP